MNRIQYHPRAIRQLGKLAEAERIRTAIKALAGMPDCRNVKKLVNHDYQYRLRVGNYRVFFDFDGEIRVVYIEEVKKRDSKTY